ncbi:MAG: hypothetical protein LW817_01540 [Candidatus Caenarcaniphilales bacterium]|jgi:hypothetical protein|nr:hypothetical protein [Candidatus Caenarcaniphilales bacterium]
MAVFQFVPYVNAAERLSDAEYLVSQTQADNAFAEQLSQQAILGIGDADAARNLLSVVRELLGNARINQQFWLEVAKGDKDQYKKSIELIKSS